MLTIFKKLVLGSRHLMIQKDDTKGSGDTCMLLIKGDNNSAHNSSLDYN
jgi:hypothetical protein